MNYHKAIAFGAGPCKLCTECRMMSGCAYPDQARPSMEGCCIDVYATARNNGFQIHVLKDRDDSRNYFGLLMIE
jgi:predicted metal-binding protein